MAYTYEGLRLKHNEAIAGGAAQPGTYALAHDIQNGLGNGLRYFTAFNDGYHQSEAYFRKKGNRTQSLHGLGLAMDVVLSNGRQGAPQAMATIRQMMAAKGLREGRDFKIIDEYSRPSAGATGGHLDVRFLNTAAADKYAGGKSGSVTAPVTPATTTPAAPALPTVTTPQLSAAVPQLAQQTNVTAPQTDWMAELEKEQQLAQRQADLATPQMYVPQVKDEFFTDKVVRAAMLTKPQPKHWTAG